MSILGFYEDLECIDNFSSIFDKKHFKLVPENWSVVITDIQGSTDLIKEGRYKDVNWVGAAAIACVQNTLGTSEVPLVFGGDGATFVLPPKAMEMVREELLALKTQTLENLGINLRVGSVTVAAIHQSKHRVTLGKYRIAGKQSIAIFKGGGVSEAERLIKAMPEPASATPQAQNRGDANLEGLSCRWQPIPSKKGFIVSVLVVNRHDDDEKILGVYRSIEKVCGKNLKQSNPLFETTLRGKGLFDVIAEEAKREKSKRFGSSLLKKFRVFGEGLIVRSGLINKYIRDISGHCDFQKYDDALRLTIDCTPKQKTRVVEILDEFFEKGDVCYGIHQSQYALMTCFVPSIRYGEHIHFLDGADGGFSLAALGLKKQMREAGMI